jgi:hypothetical protein
MEITNRHGLPDALVAAVRNDPYSSGGSDITATSLIDSPRIRELVRRNKDSITVDVVDRIWALFGSAVHHILEQSQTEARVEERLFVDFEGWVISGQFDRLLVEEKVLQDWKVTTAYKVQSSHAGWERQLNVLRWLCAQNGIEVDKLQVVAIIRDWQASRASADGTYPVANVAVIHLPVWDLTITEEYIRERIHAHQDARAGDLPLCTDEERWYSGGKFALIKPGNKRALKVLDTREEALAALAESKAPSLTIEERPGRYVRCENYCEAAPWCEQWQSYLKEQADAS